MASTLYPKLLVAVLLVLLSACAPGGRHAAAPPKVAPANTSVAETFQRQALQAMDGLRDQVIANPDDLAARLALADRYWKTGALELAIDHYRLAATRFPDHAKVAMLLARALRDYDRSPEAIQALERFRERNGTCPPGLLSLLGILEDDAGQFPEAEKAYRAALEQAPERADLHNNLGYNLLLQQKAHASVEQFQEALKIDPRSQIAHDNLGLALLAQWKDDSQPKDALLHWQSVSDPASAHNNLAAVLIEQGRYAEARKELEIALSYQVGHPAALANYRLAGELDGGSTVPAAPVRNSFWKRVKTVFKSKVKEESS